MNRWMVPVGLVFLAACASTPPKDEPVALTPAPKETSAGHATEATASSAGATASVPSSATTSSTNGSESSESAGKEPSMLALSAPAYAGAPPPQTTEEAKEKVPDRFMLRAGGFAMANISTSAALAPAGSSVGGTINFNEVLGLDSSSFSGRVDAVYRFGEHGAIGFSWYSFNLTGSRAIDRTIDWNGQTIPINTQVDSFLDQDIYKLNYRYSIYHNDEIEFGAEAGFDIQHFKVGLNTTNFGETSEAATAPLPVFGAYINYHFTPRLLLGIEYEFFFLELDNASGSLQDLLLSLEYRVFKNVALGAAFNFYSLDAEYTSSSSTLDLQQQWNGLLLYASLYL